MRPTRDTRSPGQILADARIHLQNPHPGEHRTTCPRCSHLRRKKADRCLAIRIDDDGAVWHCWNCGWKAGTTAHRTPQKTVQQTVPATPPRTASTTDMALRLWQDALPIGASLAELYLRRRGVTCPLPEVLRFHPSCPRGQEERRPAMVALYSDIRTCAPCGIHRTFLAADATKTQDGTAKMMLGRARDAVIRLTPDDEITMGLAICEGIETGLSLLSHGIGVWALGSAGGIEAFPVLSGIECLSVYADNDEAGLAAARACAGRWLRAGQEARILRPRQSGTDFNDVVRGEADTHA